MDERWRERVELYKRSLHRHERAARVHGCAAAIVEALRLAALAQRERTRSQLNRDIAAATRCLVGEFSEWEEPHVRSPQVYEAAAIAHDSVAEVFDVAGIKELADAERQIARDCRFRRQIALEAVQWSEAGGESPSTTYGPSPMLHRPRVGLGSQS